MTKPHYKAIQWCINTYGKKQLDLKIWELYLYLYDQNN